MINIAHEIGGVWILPRLARALVDGLPNARACSPKDTKLLNAPDTEFNYYFNDDSFHHKTHNTDVVFFDHPKHNFRRALKADHIICMTPQYQRKLQAMGREADLVIQPTDTEAYSPRLVLGFIGRYKGKIDYSKRKGRVLLEKAAELPWIELRATMGKIDVHDMPAFYRGLDRVICPGDPEGGPMALTEGLSSGVRVIIPETVGIAEMFPEGIDSFQSGDWPSLKALLERLYEEKMALHRLVEKYTWAYWVEQHRVIFDRLRQAQLKSHPTARVIVVVATPEIDEITQHTIPAIEAYADRCNAKLIVWRDCPPEYQHPKYRLMGLAQVDADRILHMDADCYPKDDAPDIFEEHPPGWVYMWDERGIRNPGEVEQFQRTITGHTGEAVMWPRSWWNPGVMLMDREHAQLLRMPPWDVTDKNHLWYGTTVKNQPWINWLLAKGRVPVQAMDRKWNYVTTLPHSKPEDGHILHFGVEKVPDAYQRKCAITKQYAETKRPPNVLMATVVHGSEFEALYKLIEPYHLDYAKRHGYDYRVIREPLRDDWPSPSWWKLDLHEDLDDYDAVVFVDADAWPWDDAPDITQAVPRGKFGAFNSLTLSYMNDRNCHSQKSYRDWCERAGLHWQDHDPIDIGYYINGGVWVCWRDARDVLLCDKPMETPLYVEQHQLNWNLYERPGLYHEFGRQWNWGHLGRQENQTAALTAYIAHLNGVRNRRCAMFDRVVEQRRLAATRPLVAQETQKKELAISGVTKPPRQFFRPRQRCPEKR